MFKKRRAKSTPEVEPSWGQCLCLDQSSQLESLILWGGWTRKGEQRHGEKAKRHDLHPLRQPYTQHIQHKTFNMSAGPTSPSDFSFHFITFESIFAGLLLRFREFIIVFYFSCKLCEWMRNRMLWEWCMNMNRFPEWFEGGSRLCKNPEHTPRSTPLSGFVYETHTLSRNMR